MGLWVDVHKWGMMMTPDNDKTYAVELTDGTTTIVTGDDALANDDIVYAVDVDTMDTVIDDESGQGMVEYFLIIALVLVVVVVLLTLLGDGIGTVFSELMNMPGF